MNIVDTAPVLDLTLEQVKSLTDELANYHAVFSPLYLRREHRERAYDYLQGLLTPGLDRKSVEPIALALHGADVNTVRSLQQFVGEGAWQDEALLDRHREEVAQYLGKDDGVFIVDGSDFPKQGQHSIGVKRQYCGELGKRANCQAGVFLAYASGHGYTLLDRRLYLPEEWVSSQDFARLRRRCALPEEISFRTKPELAAEMVEALRSAGTLPGRWLTCDEAFGCDAVFLDRVAQTGLYYLAEVPHQTRFWMSPPPVEIPLWHGRGRPATRVRLAEEAPPAEAATEIARRLPEAAWRRYTIKEGSKGPMVAQFAFLRATSVSARMPGPDVWLLFRRWLEEPDDPSADPAALKVYVSNAPVRVAEEELVRLTGMRWPVESCFEEGKQMLGMGQYEVRSWRGWHHHMTMVILAHGFLVRLQQHLKKGDPVQS